MHSEIEMSAQAIADALAPTQTTPSARWRWGTVKSVSEYGTMNVEVGGSELVGIRCAQHVMGAQVGDRVRVLYCGTEAMVDAVRASSALMSVPSPSMDADTQAAWLDALGLTVEVTYFTANTSNVTMQGESYTRAYGKANQINLVFTTKRDIPTWDNQNFIVGTMDRACAYSKQYMVAMCQINNNWALMQAGINSSGEIRLRTLGTAIPSGTWVWVFGTYISV